MAGDERHSDPYALPPEVEEERLRSLDQLHIVGTPPEGRFGHITRMARVALGVPMSAINLIDRDLQWCKEFSGDSEPDFNVPRDQSVCRATIARAYQKPAEPALIFEDLADSEFAELPAIAAEGGVRFYAGFPLFGPGGHPVGTFCIYDTVPRRLDPKDKATFAELAAWAQRELESSDELQRAASIQQQLLPSPLADLPGYSIATLFEPAYAVGGDFWDHYRRTRGLTITVADVMGKGLGASLLAANVRSALRAASRTSDRVVGDFDLRTEVASVAEQLSDDLARTGTFVTLFHANLEMASGRLVYVDAGHGIAGLVRAGGVEVEVFGSEDLPMGINDDADWSSREVTMQPGDMLVIASDGLLDLFGDTAVVSDAFEFCRQYGSPTELCSAVEELGRGRLSSDDVTVIALRREESADA